MPMKKHVLVPLCLLLGLQVLDVLVHGAAQQIEAIRVASNIIISAGTLMALFLVGSASRLGIVVGAAIYLVLNLVFLAQHGVTNPATQTLRIPLFVFFVGSLGLSYWLHRRSQ